MVRETDRGRTIVFLDPDTGLQPTKPSWEHVLDSELASIWAAMPAGHVLVFYQHKTSYNGSPWLEPKRAQFESAVGLEPGASKVAHVVQDRSGCRILLRGAQGFLKREPHNAVFSRPGIRRVALASKSPGVDCPIMATPTPENRLWRPCRTSLLMPRLMTRSSG